MNKGALRNLFNKIKEFVVNFITSRLVILSAVLILAAAGLVYRLFFLQIIKGEEYLDSFQLKIIHMPKRHFREESFAPTR